MGKFDFSAEAAVNMEQKCLVVLVLDVSGSMRIGNRLNELNKGLQEFYNDISNDETTAQRLEIAIVTFNHEIKTIQHPALVENFMMPTLKAIGGTAMVDAVNEAIDMVQERKNWYKEQGQTYYRPWIILITDGEPDENQDIDGLAARIKKETEGKHFQFLPIGVDDANMTILGKIQGNIPPAKMQGVKFHSFFQWLSASMSTITSSSDGESVNISKGADDWMEHFVI